MYLYPVHPDQSEEMSCDCSKMSCDHQDQHDEVEFLEAMMAEAGEFEWREETEGGRDDGRIITGTLNAILHLETPLILELARRERGKAGSLGKRSPSLPHPEPGFSSANGTSSTRRKTGSDSVGRQYSSVCMVASVGQYSSVCMVVLDSILIVLDSIPVSAW